MGGLFFEVMVDLDESTERIELLEHEIVEITPVDVIAVEVTKEIVQPHRHERFEFSEN